MQHPLQVTFRGMEPSPAVEARVREKAQKLERYFDRIISCQVVVEAPPKHRHKGGAYSVRIDIDVPGNELVVNRPGDADHSHEDVYVAIRDAFQAATRRLEDFARRQRGDVKVHEEVFTTGRVVRLPVGEDFGFIEGPTGPEVYFHRNSVLGGAFDKLVEGSMVTFLVAHGEGEHGPQASTVRLG